MPSPLEKWATARLEALGVDGVFAPYIVAMLSADGDTTQLDDPEDVKFNIHQVLMGWLSPEDEVRRMALGCRASEQLFFYMLTGALWLACDGCCL